MKSIMYHYVRPEPRDLPHFRYLHLEDFRTQLDWLAAHYPMITREDFTAALRAGAAPADAVVLTFDDGLMDHWRWVLPELQQRGLWGIFYVPTAPYTTSRLLDVHRIHALLGRHGGTAVMEAISDAVEDHMLVDGEVQAFRERTYRNQDNDANTTLAKRTLNYFIGYEWREAVLDQIWDRLGAGLASVEDWYIPAGQLAAFERAGMMIGSHSVSHRVFSKLPVPEQEREIQDSFAHLEAACGGLPTRTFCYPYGGFHTFTDDTERLLSEAGCAFAFNVEYRDVTESDVRNRPQALPRHDCNRFPHGTASLGPNRPGREP